jgi:hypothetical protein
VGVETTLRIIERIQARIRDKYVEPINDRILKKK